jgi:hypothetical protein
MQELCRELWISEPGVVIINMHVGLTDHSEHSAPGHLKG